jgi:DNA-binding SARP family transcriptional activator
MSIMSTLRVRLFEKLSIERGEHTVGGIGAGKAQELFCYLMLYRDRPHPRETLACLLWGDSSAAQSKKYLRQTLWQLQAALSARSEPIDGRAVLVEPDWIYLNPHEDLWLDVAVFEQAFTHLQGVPGRELEPGAVRAVQDAVSLYRGDLLEGWYQDWCLFERERLQEMFLVMLDKLMGYCEAHQEHEAGLTYGMRILRYDRAHERTHRRLMRLHYLAGDRTSALRQYERCTKALDEELGVRPSRSTVALYEQIRADWFNDALTAPADSIVLASHDAAYAPLPELVQRLKGFQAHLIDLERQIRQDIQAIEVALHRPH